MRHFRFLLTTTVCVASVLVAGLAVQSASAAPTTIVALGGNVDAGRYYNTGQQSWQWSNRLLTGATIVTEDSNLYFINPFDTATISWTSLLLADYSGEAPNAPGQANGVFGGAGTMSISGSVYDINFTPLFTGTLLTANVSPFEILESSASSNSLFSVNNVLVTPIGGWLVDGVDNTYAHLTSSYSFAVGFSATAQNGGPIPVQDFSYDIWATSGSQWNMAQVIPEPATLAFLGLGVLACVRRRRV